MSFKKIIGLFVFSFVSLAYADVKDSIKDLADKIYSEVGASNASLQDLNSANAKLSDALALVRGSATNPPNDGSDEDEVSAVNIPCLDNLYQKISGNLGQDQVVAWAKACRNVNVEDTSCFTSNGSLDNACYNSLYQKISGSFTPDMIPQVNEVCKQKDITCRVDRKITSTVSTDCLSQNYHSLPGNATVDQAIAWTTSCRNVEAGSSCSLISGDYNAACVNSIYQMISGTFSQAQAAAVATACRTKVYSCR